MSEAPTKAKSKHSDLSDTVLSGWDPRLTETVDCAKYLPPHPTKQMLSQIFETADLWVTAFDSANLRR